MKDKATGLTIRTLDATDKYIAEHIIRNNTNYTFIQALKDTGYTSSYVKNFSEKIWNNMAVQTKISSFKAKMQAKTELTIQNVLDNIEYGIQICKEHNLMAALARFVEMQGRYLAMFTENISVTDTIRQRELEERERLELAELMQLRITHKYNLMPLSRDKAASEATEALPSAIEIVRNKYELVKVNVKRDDT